MTDTTTQQVLKSQGCSPSYHCAAITRPRASTQLESAASSSLTEMLVLSQRNKENILTVREWLSEFSWCSRGEKTLLLLFLSVQWKPAEVGVCAWPSIMRFRYRHQWQSFLRIGTLRCLGRIAIPSMKMERDKEEDKAAFIKNLPNGTQILFQELRVLVNSSTPL